MESKSFEEILFEFRNNLEMHLGPVAMNGIVKIALTPQLYSVFEQQFITRERYYPAKSTGEVTIMGINIVARRRDDF